MMAKPRTSTKKTKGTAVGRDAAVPTKKVLGNLDISTEIYDGSDVDTLVSQAIKGVKVNNAALTPSSDMVVSIPNATTAAYGATKLNTSTTSTSTTEAATPSAVRSVYYAAALKSANNELTGSNTFSGNTNFTGETNFTKIPAVSQQGLACLYLYDETKYSFTNYPISFELPLEGYDPNTGEYTTKYVYECFSTYVWGLLNSGNWYINSSVQLYVDLSEYYFDLCTEEWNEETGNYEMVPWRNAMFSTYADLFIDAYNNTISICLYLIDADNGDDLGYLNYTISNFQPTDGYIEYWLSLDYEYYHDENWNQVYAVPGGMNDAIPYSFGVSNNPSSPYYNYQYEMSPEYYGYRPTLDTALATEARVEAVEAALAGKANTNHNHNASAITAGTLNAARIPNLDAGKITSGTFAAARIPNLAASKINSGTFDAARLPKATANSLGAVKPDGTTITVDANGVITGASTVPIATTSVPGIVKPDGTTISVDANGVITGLGGDYVPLSGGVSLSGNLSTEHNIVHVGPDGYRTYKNLVLHANDDNNKFSGDSVTLMYEDIYLSCLTDATVLEIPAKVKGTLVATGEEATIDLILEYDSIEEDYGVVRNVLDSSRTDVGNIRFNYNPSSYGPTGYNQVYDYFIGGSSYASDTVEPVIAAKNYIYDYNDIPIATPSTPGIVKPDGTTITIDANGVITGASTTPTATTTVTGIVRPDGETIGVSDGVIYIINGGGGGASTVIPYPFVVHTLTEQTIDGVATMCATLQNIAVNVLEIDSAAKPIQLTFPAKPANNMARDFLLRLDITCSLCPTITFVTQNSEEIDYESLDDDWSTFYPGTSLLTFTETKPGQVSS